MSSVIIIGKKRHEPDVAITLNHQGINLMVSVEAFMLAVYERTFGRSRILRWIGRTFDLENRMIEAHLRVIEEVKQKSVHA